MIEKLRIKITLIASLVVTLYAFINNETLLKTCYTIIISIVLFYILGVFIEDFLETQHKKINSEKYLEENVELNYSNIALNDENIDIVDEDMEEYFVTNNEIKE